MTRPVCSPDLFSRQSREYSLYRPDYPPQLFSFIAAQCEQRRHAWDAGAGNGQIAVALAGYFDRISATDISQAQIDNAAKHERVDYHVAAAEHSALASSSMDAVVTGQALHWFDIAAFFAETERVLKPGGLLCVLCYTLPRVDSGIDEVLDDFHYRVLGDYWPVQRQLVDSRYQGINLPWSEQPGPAMDITRHWNRRQLLDYVSTWSAVNIYRERNSQDPLSGLESRLQYVWPGDSCLVVRWPVTIKITIKPR